ncbi:MAG: biotin/lipoyl-containing protein [Candidatus Caldatribacteriaceae bacterium]
MRRFWVRVNGEEYRVEVMEIIEEGEKKGFAIQDIARVQEGKERTGGLKVTTTLRSPMPGQILSVSVKKGDEVKAGQVAVILEAMKMENEIAVEHPGVVTNVYVSENDTVDVGDPLLEIEEWRE